MQPESGRQKLAAAGAPSLSERTNHPDLLLAFAATTPFIGQPTAEMLRTAARALRRAPHAPQAAPRHSRAFAADATDAQATPAKQTPKKQAPSAKQKQAARASGRGRGRGDARQAAGRGRGRGEGRGEGRGRGRGRGGDAPPAMPRVRDVLEHSVTMIDDHDGTALRRMPKGAEVPMQQAVRDFVRRDMSTPGPTTYVYVPPSVGREYEQKPPPRSIDEPVSYTHLTLPTKA